MERYICVRETIKNLCPYPLDAVTRLAHYCERCKLPDYYTKKGKVPDSPIKMVCTNERL